MRRGGISRSPPGVRVPRGAVTVMGIARGAIYHHFPGGKGQLVAEAADRFGGQARQRFAALEGAAGRPAVELATRLT